MPVVSTGSITITDTLDGLNARLTNDSHVLPSSADGSTVDYAGCATTMSVFLGQSDITSQWTFTASPSNGLAGALVGSTYTVTNLSGLAGFVDIIANRVGFDPIVCRFTVAKARQGQLGPVVYLLPSAGGFTFLDNQPLPASQSIALTLLRRDVADPVVFSSDGVAFTTDSGMFNIANYAMGIPSTGAGDVCYVDVASFGDRQQATIIATVGDFTTSFTLLRISNTTAQPGATRNVGRGLWQTGILYEVGDMVLDGGYGWICTLGHTSSTLIRPPVFPTTQNSVWTLTTYKGDTGNTGPQGLRGTITTARAISGSAWLDSEADAAITAAGGAAPLTGDVVTLFNSATGFSQTRVRSSGGTWTTLTAFFGGDVIVNGTLATSKMIVTDTTNLIDDFGFEYGGGSWSATARSRIQTITSPRLGGTRGLVHVANGTILDSNYAYVDCQPGDQFYAECWIRKETASTVGNVGLQATVSRDNTLHQYPSFQSVSVSSLAQGVWTKLSGSITIPAGINRLELRASVRNDVPSGTFTFDDFILRRRNEGSLIVDGSINAAKLSAGAVEADKIAANAVRIQHLLVAPNNLNPDPNFADEDFWSQPRDASGWFFEVAAPGNGPQSIDIPKSLTLGARGATRAHAYTRVMPMPGAAGRKVRLRARAWNGTADIIYVAVSFLNASGNQTGFGLLQWNPASGLATRDIQLDVPSGTTRYQFIVYNNGATAIASNTFALVGAISLDFATDSSLIVDGSVVATKIATGAVQADKVAANAIRTQHLLVTPNNLNPDPHFRDQAAWRMDNQTDGTGQGVLGTNSSGWYAYETANPAGEGIPAVVGSRFLVLWSGRAGQNNNARYALYAERDLNNKFAVTPGQTLELKASVHNASNHWVCVAIEYDKVNNQGVGGHYTFLWNPGESATKSVQIVVPADAAWGRIVVYNQGFASAGVAYSGAAYVANVTVREAADFNLIVDGAIRGTKVAADGIDGTHITATTIWSKHIGGNEIITESGNIKDLTVQTLHIGLNAVTVPTISASSVDTWLPSTTNVQTTLLNHVLSPTTNYVYVAVNVDIANTDATLFYVNQFRLLVNGSVVFTSENMMLANNGAPANTSSWSYSGFIPVNPGVANTISVAAFSANALNNWGVRSTNKTIFALEVKR